MGNELWLMVAWVVGACGLGFAISAVFAGWLKLSRRTFLIPYIFISSIFFYTFIVINEIDIAAILAKNWVWGILAGGLIGVFLVITVKRQPVSRQSNGAELVFDITWVGFVYGFIDGLFLNIMPVVAVWAGAAQFGWTATLPGKIGLGLAGLLASLLVTLTYHLGYPEFRNKRVSLVLVGNSLITLAFLLSGSPIGSIVSHTAMHVAAVFQGPETTIQLPPHYPTIVKPDRIN